MMQPNPRQGNRISKFLRVDSGVAEYLTKKAEADRACAVDRYCYQIRHTHLLELHVASVTHTGKRPAANIQLLLELSGVELLHTLTCANSAPEGTSNEFKPSR